ncbi:unnamed protein product [Meloidogyne enterolobii]|uniref:Uncharacterized protein n=1 Tax=Meloidogyne enterolobii TaxID=390850 RepID=A0ACB1A4Y4_MELEN
MRPPLIETLILAFCLSLNRWIRDRRVTGSRLDFPGSRIFSGFVPPGIDLILCNGPAICLPICLFARLFNFLRIKRIKIIFVESICRVQTLSLTGRILYHLNIPNAFLVQWPSLKEKYNKTQFIGRLV